MRAALHRTRKTCSTPKTRRTNRNSTRRSTSSLQMSIVASIRRTGIVSRRSSPLSEWQPVDFSHYSDHRYQPCKPRTTLRMCPGRDAVIGNAMRIHAVELLCLFRIPVGLRAGVRVRMRVVWRRWTFSETEQWKMKP